MFTNANTNASASAAPPKVHYAPFTRPESDTAERRQLRSPPPKPKGKKLRVFSLGTRTRAPAPTPAPTKMQIRKLEYDEATELGWAAMPECWTTEYTLLPLAEAQQRDEIVRRMFPL